MNIGVFDSGFGGLTILKALRETLPIYDYLYLGDNARTPYGDRSAEVIYEFTRQGVQYLFAHDCNIVVLACNTASAHALVRLEKEFLPVYFPDRMLLGVISPLVKNLVGTSSSIGIMGTRATITSKTYDRALTLEGEKSTIVSVACPLLVPLIEEGMHESIPAKMILKNYLTAFKQQRVDTLVLACTHYPLLEKQIARIMGRSVAVINPGIMVARSLEALLLNTPTIEATLSKNGRVTFLTTDEVLKITNLATRFWGEPIQIKKVVIE